MSALFLLGLTLSPTVPAASAATIRIERAMVDADPAPTKDSASGGYARLTSMGRDDKLVAVRCTCAKDVDLHRIVRVPKTDMLGKQTLDLPAGKAVEVKPGSDWHFWVGDIQQPLVAGQKVQLVLTFEKAGEVPVDFAIEAKTKDAWAAFDAPR